MSQKVVPATGGSDSGHGTYSVRDWTPLDKGLRASFNFILPPFGLTIPNRQLLKKGCSRWVDLPLRRQPPDELGSDGNSRGPL
jgi:hypothetical protein